MDITPHFFWEHSPQEILDIINSKNKVLEFNRKNDYIRDYYLANTIVGFLGPLLSKDVKPPELWNCAPEYIFEKEKVQIEELRKEQELALHKERMREFVTRFNEIRNSKKL